MSKKTIVSEDKHSVSLSISGEFSTYELEKLVFELSQIRGSMQPPVVPHQPIKSEQAYTSIQNDPAMNFHVLKDGNFQLWFRNSCFGWMVFNVNTRDACTIRSYFNSNIPEDIVTVFDNGTPGGSDTAQ